MQEYVSVIIPTWNRAEFLEKAVDSVLNQTWPHFELIVVDDGSDDSTRDLVAGYGSKVAYVRQENLGPAAARNTGVGRARYDLIAFLDSDDLFEPDKLEVQVAAMRSQPDFLISHTQEIWFKRGCILNQKKKHRKDGGDIFFRSLALCVVGMSTVMVRRQLFEMIGFFDEELPCCEDYDFWLRVSVSHPFLLIDQPLTRKNGGRPDQVSFRYRVGMDRFRIRAIERLLAAEVLSFEQRKSAIQELVRKGTIYGIGCLKHERNDEGRNFLALALKYQKELDLMENSL